MRLLPALIAGSACGLMSGPASALQLGDLDVQSALGQPLRASIAYALSPNEQLVNDCILLKQGTSADGLTLMSRASISITSGTIVLTGTTPLREPMLAMQVTVNCPYTANLTRAYTIMLDPASTTAESPTVVSQRSAAITATPATVRPNRQRQRTVRTNVETTPIALSTVHIVAAGETLSDIATRIENRPVGLWPAVEALFAANPDAFINGDVNLLKAGSRLTIPSFDNVTAPVLSSVAEAAPTATTAAEPESVSAYAGLVNSEPATLNVGSTTANTELLGLPPENDSIPSAAVDTTAMIAVQPGDISVAGDTSFVSPIESPADSPPLPVTSDVDLPNLTKPAADAAPVVATVASPARVAAPAKTNTDWSWMMWLAGSGIALILGLLLFGRKLRARFNPDPVGAPEEALIKDDEDTARNETLREFDIPIGDLPPGEQEYMLDADLGAGTGFDAGGDVDDAQDFGFSSTQIAVADLDMELPEEIAAERETHPTDIIPPQRVEQASILDEEILPEDDEYDLSMIVDATRQNLGDDVSTEKDLQAIPFDGVADEELDVECTLNDEFGLTTLEKDYEDELTATQAANKEIEKAAAELALRMAEVPDDETSVLPAAHSGEFSETDATVEVTSEVTVQMAGAPDAENDDFSHSDDTGFHNEPTAQMPTVEDDATAEMVVESGHVNTRKSTG